MGVVYKAEDTKLKRTVALKFLPSKWTLDPGAKARFMQEAQAASSLDHNNICTIYEIGETDDGQLFIAMACYEGETLQKKIERGPLKVEEAIDIFTQIAQGLNKAHSKKIVHRDIKPANVIVTTDGVAKILDFGLAKLSGRTKLTKEGTTVGTIAYLSPEQARAEEVDHRTDIWSLGVTVYEMITGQLPFKGDYEQAVVYSIINKNPEPPTALRTGVPMELERIINKATAKNPNERYQHADEILADLNRLKSETEAARKTRPAGQAATESLPQRATRVIEPTIEHEMEYEFDKVKKKKSRVKWAVMVSLAVLLAILIVWFAPTKKDLPEEISEEPTTKSEKETTEANEYELYVPIAGRVLSPSIT